MPNKFMIAKPKMKWTRLKRIIFGISPTLAELLDLKFEIKTEDRRFLENQIFDSINKKFGQSAEVPSIFRLTKGSIHATSFSFDC